MKAARKALDIVYYELVQVFSGIDPAKVSPNGG